MFKVGDKVVYPLHGAGKIESIEEKSIMNERQSYYIIKMPGEVKVMVPTAKAEEIGVRYVIDEHDSTEMSMNWNKRYRDNMERMKTGDIYEVADIVRNLSFKQKDKGLSTAEKKMLLNAKQILVSELTLAGSQEKDDVEQLVDNKINCSYEMHSAILENNIEEEKPKIMKVFTTEV